MQPAWIAGRLEPEPGFSRFLYKNFFGTASMYMTTVFTTAWIAGMGFDAVTTSIWETNNKGVRFAPPVFPGSLLPSWSRPQSAAVCQQLAHLWHITLVYSRPAQSQPAASVPLRSLLCLCAQKLWKDCKDRILAAAEDA